MIEVKFQHVVMYDTDNIEEAVKWAEEDLRTKIVRGNDLEIVASMVLKK